MTSLLKLVVHTLHLMLKILLMAAVDIFQTKGLLGKSLTAGTSMFTLMLIFADMEDLSCEGSENWWISER